MAVIEKRLGQNGVPNYRVKVRIRGHRPLSCTFEKLTDAREWAKNTEADIKRGLRFDDHHAQKHTLNEAIELYKQAARLTTHPRHLYQREKQLDWWSEKLGDNLLAKITADKVNVCKRELMTRTSPRGGGDKPLKAATVNHYLCALSAVLNHAMREMNWIRHNPMQEVKKMQVKNARVRFLSPEERDAILKACKAPGRHRLLFPLVMVAMCTGMRKSEILALHWKDVDLDKRVVIVQASKNGDRRSVPITGPALEVMQDLRKIRHIASDLVFARKDGVGPIELKKQWEAALEQSKVENFRFHDLRHTAATYLLQAGASLPELSAILGHRSLQMVKRYAHMAENHAVAVVERMTKQVFG
jgi:integrase